MSQLPPYTQPYGQYQPPRPPPPAAKPSGLAITSLVLGIVGVVLSFMPIFNNLTAAGAFVGFVLGFIGLWKSRMVMSGIGVFLCGLAVILTVVAQTQLGDDLAQLGDDLDSISTSSTPVRAPAAPADAPPITPDKGYAPAPGDFALEMVTVEEKCFGSAGCLVTFRVTVTYLGAVLPDDATTFTAVYDVHGGSEPMTDRFTITGSQVSVPGEQMIQTDSPSAVLTAVVTKTL